LVKLAQGCTTAIAKIHVKVNHTYAFVFEAADGKLAVYVGLVRALIACVDAGSTAKRKRLRQFRCLPRTDATGKYFCHPWALVKVTANEQLQLELCKTESHEFYAMTEAAYSSLSGSEYSDSSTDEESGAEAGGSRQGAGRRKARGSKFAVNGLEMEVPVVWSVPPAQPVFYTDAAMPLWHADMLALVQQHSPLTRQATASGKQRK
jgi:hypothetical protein